MFDPFILYFPFISITRKRIVFASEIEGIANNGTEARCFFLVVDLFFTSETHINGVGNIASAQHIKPTDASSRDVEVVTTTVSSTTVRTGSSSTSQENFSKRVAPKDDPVSKVTTPSTDPVKAKSDLFDRGLTYFEDWTTAHRKEYFQQAGNRPSTNLGILQYFSEQHGFPNVTCSVKGGGCSNMPSQHALLNKRHAHSVAQMDHFKFAGLYINQFMAYHAMIIESLEHARDDVHQSCSEFARKFFHPTQEKKKTPCLAVIIPMAILALFAKVSVAAFTVTAKALSMIVALFAPAKRSEEVLSVAPFVRGFGIIGASLDENGRGSYVLEIRKNPKAKRHANIAAQDQNNALSAVTEVSKVLQLYGFVVEAPKKYDATLS